MSIPDWPTQNKNISSNLPLPHTCYIRRVTNYNQVDVGDLKKKMCNTSDMVGIGLRHAPKKNNMTLARCVSDHWRRVATYK